MGVQVVVAYDHGAGVAPVQILEQSSERCFLLSRTSIVGLSAGIESALVADAYRVGVVVQAVGADHVFRASGLNLSVTTDDVVVADAEVKTSLAMPGIDLSHG